jgi:hypothetical protein
MHDICSPTIGTNSVHLTSQNVSIDSLNVHFLSFLGLGLRLFFTGIDGLEVHFAVGFLDGDGVSNTGDLDLHGTVCNIVGDAVRDKLGSDDGEEEGDAVGDTLGSDDGEEEGDAVGDTLGSDDGEEEGDAVGDALGSDDGEEEGNAVGDTLGSDDGEEVGDAVGEEDGANGKSNMRTRPLPRSEIIILPVRSTATLLGKFNKAVVAGNPSPLKPFTPQVPATVVIIPSSFVTIRIQ